MRNLSKAKQFARTFTTPVDSQLISLARSQSCALLPHLSLLPSKAKRGSLALHVTGVQLPSHFPVVLVPCSSLVSLNTVLDTDRSHLFPGVPDIATALEYEEYLEMLDTIVVSYYLMCQLAYRSQTQNSGTAGWVRLNLNMLQMTPAETSTALQEGDHKVFEKFCDEIYDQLEKVFPMGTRKLFRHLMQYVLRSLLVIAPSAPVADPTNAAQSSPSRPAAVFSPFLDVVSNKLVDEGNVRIAKVDLATAKEVARDSSLLGAQQFLKNPKRDLQEEFLVLTTTRDVANEEELSLSCDLDQQFGKRTEDWSIVDRIRYGL